MSRRHAPRPAATAFRAALRATAPKTRLAAVQAAWTEAVGDRIAAVAQPVSERGGEVLVECSDTVWAQELDLMGAELEEALRAHLGEAAPEKFRFRAKSGGE